MRLTTPPLLWFVIDDDLDDQEIFLLAARQVDPSIRCEFANDGVHAMERVTNELSLKPDCIFLDVNMPRMNGIECLEALRAIDRYKQVPIFVCSTSSDPKIVAKVKDLGANDFIVKPATFAELVTILQEIARH